MNTVHQIEIPMIGFYLSAHEITELMKELDINDFPALQDIINHIAGHIYDITESVPAFWSLSERPLSRSQKTKMAEALISVMITMNLSPTNRLLHKFYSSDSSLIRTAAKLLIAESNSYAELPDDIDIAHAMKILIYMAASPQEVLRYKQRLYNSRCVQKIIRDWDKLIAPSRRYGISIRSSFARNNATAHA